MVKKHIIDHTFNAYGSATETKSLEERIKRHGSSSLVGCSLMFRKFQSRNKNNRHLFLLQSSNEYK